MVRLLTGCVFSLPKRILLETGRVNIGRTNFLRNS